MFIAHLAKNLSMFSFFFQLYSIYLQINNKNTNKQNLLLLHVKQFCVSYMLFCLQIPQNQKQS